ncbi:MAG TPA: outer membrane protein assembly factor BamA [Thioalkalivibrio sp.]|nr:outer membrane protein assembly factor BamA [Thioalkalivibrio sp.]
MFAAVPQAQAESFVVRDIEVEGLERIAPGTVFTYLPLKVGDAFDERQSADVVRALFRTGFFDDVELRRRGDVLVVFVTERPAIADIRFSGNKDIPKDQLEEALKEVGITKGRVFNRSVLERLERELRQQYFARGKYNVKIDVEVEELPRNRVDIDITISEGKVAKIRKVTIVGNEDFDEDDLLDDFDSGIPSWWAIFSSRDEYSKQKLGGDLERLRSTYLDRGYAEFNIDSTQVAITPDKRDIYVTVNVDEGNQYRIRSIKLAGNALLPEDDLMALVDLEPGDVFARARVTNSITRITDRLGDAGYAFANVNAIPELDEESREVDLTLFIDPGKRVYVRRINFQGNYKTRDEVLRRELRQMEAGWYAASQINRSKIRLQRLPYIADVNVRTRRVPGTDDQVDLDISVVERLAGSFSIGAGYSQSEGLLFNIAVSEDNFMGSGKRVAINANTSSVNTIYNLSYTNPYHTIDGVSRGFNVFFRETDAEEANVTRYFANRWGGNINYGIPLTEYDYFRFSFGYEDTEIVLADTAAQELQDFIAAYGEEYAAYKVEASYTHDTRNRTVFADSGNLQRISAETAVPGSDVEYYKLGYNFRQFVPVWKDRLTFSVDAKVDYASEYGSTDAMPFFEHYFAGGSRSVRGYKDLSLGPRDSLGDPLGGTFRTVGSMELLFPPPMAPESRSTRMSLFVDAGQVYEDYDTFTADELRASYGVGFTWLSPVGPLTFSLAKAFNDQPEDDLETFQFTLGAAF